ncbi:NERD domain-containing protein [Bacillus luteolus]|uniref:NERD domain-containing protein n=1 Tax=Litchfieldia luteola TaxID=682179 RepID=A0ABR9QM67_9BACI|nr:nuclease-related domain-containing protein [Cytobacillus luteolus]MBE4909605.1 NERD domain-containing protein [Cytobacillus luteolus]MBP1941006.1 hypothetical protein [Cytobacillus luteolus]
MSINKIEKSLKIRKLEAIVRRVSPSFPTMPQIEEELSISLAGQRGEQSIDYFLNFLDLKKYHLLFRGARLEYVEGIYFQLDTPIISSRYFLNIEVKNLSGELFFDQDFDQLLQKRNDGTVKPYISPVSQVKRHELQLRYWLKKHKFPETPIVSLVVITNPNAIIKTAPEHIKTVQKYVIHSANLPFKIEATEKLFTKDSLTGSQITKLSKLFKKLNTPLIPDYLQRFAIKQSDIVTGVHCQKCNTLPLPRIRGGWYCNKCNVKSTNAHIESLVDYYFLVGEIISNREFREFLNIESIVTSSKLLASLNLPSLGTFKDKVYNLKPLILR